MDIKNLSNYNEYLKYIELKKSFKFNYKGIPMEKVLAWDLINLAMDGNLKLRLKNFLSLFIYLDSNKFENNYAQFDTVITTFMDRKDHIDLFNKMMCSIDNSTMVKLNPHKKIVKIPLKTLSLSILTLLKNQAIKKYPIQSKIYLILKFVYFFNQIDLLNKKFNNVKFENKKLITVNSSVGLDALCILFFKLKNVKTFHVFHGLFGRYKSKIVTDIINGENITAECILAFSQIQKEDMVKDFHYNTDKILIAGNPKYPLKEIQCRNTFKKGIILGGTKNYDNDFAELFLLLDTVSEKMGIEFYLKSHPNSNILLHDSFHKCNHIVVLPQENTIQELFINGIYDFAITFNTTTYYECMYYHLIPLRYSKHENLDFYGLDDKFEDEDSFIRKMNQIKKKNIQEYANEMKNVLITALGMGVNNYNLYIYSK